MRKSVRSLILCALFAALCALLSQLYIPLPFTPVIINLATVAVLTAGALLGWKLGAVSMAVYMLLGAVGLPVFAGFSGGLGVLAGPTGGYIAGYVAAAAATGIVAGGSCRFGHLCAAMTAGTAACYTLGTAWYMFSTHTPLGAALMLCVVPFLLGDALKILLAAYLCVRIKPVLQKQQA